MIFIIPMWRTATLIMVIARCCSTNTSCKATPIFRDLDKQIVPHRNLTFFVPWRLKNEGVGRSENPEGLVVNVVGNLPPSHLKLKSATNLGGWPPPPLHWILGWNLSWQWVLPRAFKLCSLLKNLEAHFLFTRIGTFRKVPSMVCSKM